MLTFKDAFSARLMIFSRSGLFIVPHAGNSSHDLGVIFYLHG